MPRRKRAGSGLQAFELEGREPTLEELAALPSYLREFHIKYSCKGPVDLSGHELAPDDNREVYFIQAGKRGPIKIGVAADARKRFNTIQSSHYEQLYLLAVTRGGQEREQFYHLKFLKYHIRGEWFKPGAKLLREIEQLRPDGKQEGR